MTVIRILSVLEKVFDEIGKYSVLSEYVIFENSPLKCTNKYVLFEYANEYSNSTLDFTS